MSVISKAISIRPGYITGLSLDVGFERYLVREVKYEKSDDNREFLKNSLTSARFKEVTRTLLDNDGTFTWYNDNLLLIQESYIDPNSGKKLTESYLGEVNIENGNIFRVPYLYIEYDYKGPKNSDLLFYETQESYANILDYLKRYRKDDVQGLFIKYNGIYYPFLDKIDEIISKLFH